VIGQKKARNEKKKTITEENCRSYKKHEEIAQIISHEEYKRKQIDFKKEEKGASDDM
jgi:hypothetical protein